jgi:NlpC/P60 family putative phage cell wall peptidase
VTALEQREHVVAEARTWLGTPFHDNAAVRGAGVDCAHLVAAVYEAAGVIAPQDIEAYSPQWFLHRDAERFLAYVERVAREIEPEALQPGDLVLYRIGRAYAHGAIVVDWPGSIIHAHKLSGFVVRSGAFEMDLRDRAVRGFTFWPD